MYFLVSVHIIESAHILFFITISPKKLCALISDKNIIMYSNIR